jgi:hypothetical protein
LAIWRRRPAQGRHDPLLRAGRAVARAAAHFRQLSHLWGDHLHRLRFIRRCRDLGFTLDQVRDLLRLSSQEDQPCAEINRISAEHLAEIEHKIADLTRLAVELRRVNGRCEGGGLIADCRIIEALSP